MPASSSRNGSGTAVAIRDLHKWLGGREILRGITLDAASGEIFGLLGPNGAGKTTTLRVISTLLAPDQGSVSVAGFDVRARPAEIRRRIGVVTADVGVYPRLTARENVTYMAQLCGLNGGALAGRVADVLESLEMTAFASQRCESLSSGQRQRVAIARAVVHDPQVLIFDEPTSNLDVLASLAVRDFMVQARALGKCVILSTHVLHDAERLCDHVTILHQGRIVASGEPQAVIRESRTGDLEDAFLSLVGVRP